MRHLWPKKVKFAVTQQKMAFLSHFTSHSHYLYHKSSLTIFSLKLRARAINSRQKCITHQPSLIFCLPEGCCNSNCITLYSNEKKGKHYTFQFKFKGNWNQWKRLTSLTLPLRDCTKMSRLVSSECISQSRHTSPHPHFLFLFNLSSNRITIF